MNDRTRPPSQPPALSSSGRKRGAILDSATQLFLEKGFEGASMDEVAALARVSKQTVYKHFTDKESLFEEIVLSVAGRAAVITSAMAELFAGIEDLEQGLSRVARAYATAVMSPTVRELRRLVISEAKRFPDLAEAYFERAPGRGLEAVGAGLAGLADRGLLNIDDAPTASAHFAYLVLGPLVDRALFHPALTITDSEIISCADAGSSAFVRAYASDRA